LRIVSIEEPRRHDLIEVLVAILIFSFGLLGFVGLQARAIQFSASAEDSNRAALLANELASQLVTAQSASPTRRWSVRGRRERAIRLQQDYPTVWRPSSPTERRCHHVTWRSTGAVTGAANSVNQYVTQVIIP